MVYYIVYGNSRKYNILFIMIYIINNKLSIIDSYYNIYLIYDNIYYLLLLVHVILC